MRKLKPATITTRATANPVVEAAGDLPPTRRGPVRDPGAGNLTSSVIDAERSGAASKGDALRVTCVIEALTTGGAQRQMVYLASLLRERGHHVRFVTYHLVDYNHREHFKSQLESAGIPVEVVYATNWWRRFLGLRRAIRGGRPDVVIGFLMRPNLLVELVGLPQRRFAIIVGERTGNLGMSPWRERLRLLFHGLADGIVTNSAYLEGIISRIAPWLRHKTRRITNCVDLIRFRPPESAARAPSDQLKILVIGRFRPEKNPLGLLMALKRLAEGTPAVDAVVDWYGNNFFIGDAPSERSRPYLELVESIREHGLGHRFRIQEPVDDVVTLYQGCDVFCLPSVYESFPNVICEALACGCPILASDISDHKILVRDGENGFLFDPRSPAAIADAIRRFAALPPAQREAMGHKSRRLAEELLAPEAMARQYVRLLGEVTARRRR